MNKTILISAVTSLICYSCLDMEKSTTTHSEPKVTIDGHTNWDIYKSTDETLFVNQTYTGPSYRKRYEFFSDEDNNGTLDYTGKGFYIFSNVDFNIESKEKLDKKIKYKYH